MHTRVFKDINVHFHGDFSGEVTFETSTQQMSVPFAVLLELVGEWKLYELMRRLEQAEAVDIITDTWMR